MAMKKGKQERVAKNKANQLRNLKLASGKANSVHPMIGKAPVLRYVHLSTDSTSIIPSSVSSVILYVEHQFSQSKDKLKADLDAALSVARTSSASVGKFDISLPNEKPMRVKRKVGEA